MPAKSHKETERRRRERIDAHFVSFRTLVPNVTKRDKATLLTDVVSRVKELKQRAALVTSQRDMNSKEFWPIPNEEDELVVEYYKEDDDSADSSEMMIRISFSCEDRADLLKDLIKALKKSAQGKVMKAEISTVGGRMKSVILIQPTPVQGVLELQGTGQRTNDAMASSTTATSGGTAGSTSVGGDVTTLRRALKPVINKPPIKSFNRWLFA